MAENSNDDLKAQMKAALERKNQGRDAVGEGHHQKENGPAERGRQGGGSMFRRRSGSA
ncbi:DUF5302 family protein [Propionicimonas sp.]|uniref:DUF5302 family protein n=1 Tax=Propionicimonas sp. TaxID=1955623 RepID=UPI001E001FDC|nr:DUF5302 family protein [Propionicimonas sp.]MBU3976025.1 DUF5302 family protein [Actinomycetota bacterium]MBU3985215.1 DUF5302 family protein [Actinomycetota bacterium]MBU4008205.1 DUF5302 family protein [Actinomycetota bacterium]MBU4064581.1 DUF5302 family protein [Actinomycetota bacterium]MBU4094093.1 DUF5302 family protein [Actinomycetota bacterium]